MRVYAWDSSFFVQPLPLTCELRASGSRSAAKAAEQQADDEQHNEQKEQNLCDAGRAAGDSAKPKQSGNERDDQKHGCPIQHGKVSSKRGTWFAIRLPKATAIR